MSVVITRNLKTQEYTLYSNVTSAAVHFMVSPKTLSTKFVNQPRQIRGYHVRSVGARIWTPPSHFVYDTTFENKMLGYVVSIDQYGNRCLYENVNAACQFDNNAKRWQVQQYIGSNRVCDGGKTWWRALSEEYELFVEPPVN